MTTKIRPQLNEIEIAWGDLKARHLAHRTFTDLNSLNTAVHHAACACLRPSSPRFANPPNPPRGAPLRPSTGELGGGLGDQLALMPRSIQLDLGRLALALRSSDSGRALRRAADDLVQRHLAGVAIG